MFDPDAPDPLDRPGPRSWSERTRQERIGFVLGFAAIAGSLALIVVADTPAFRAGVGLVAVIATSWFGLRAWLAGTRSVHCLRDGRPIAAVFTVIFAVVNLGLGAAILWYAAPIVFV